MYDSAKVAERVKELCKNKKISVKQLLIEVGLGFNTMSNMKTSMPKADNLARIADRLKCSVDYLLGRTDEPNILTISESKALNVEDADLIKKYRRLPESLQTAVNQILNSYDDLQSRQATNEHLSTSENNAAAKTNTISEDAAAVVAEGEKIFGNANIDVK